MNLQTVGEMDRRGFITAAAGVMAAALAHPRDAGANEVKPATARSTALIDTNVSLGRWPFRRLPLDDTAALVAKLRSNGVTQAWAGSFDALLHKDISAVNARLADECARHGEGILLPFGALNPMLPDWEEDLRRCGELHKVRGVRLHPNYHGFKLAEPVFERLLQLASERGLIVQIAVSMEDERTLHPLVNVPPTDTAPLAPLMQKFPHARVQLLNAFRTIRGAPLQVLAKAGARFEIATLESVAGVGKMLAEIDPATLLFGSGAPFYYFESAKLKLKESPLTEAQFAAVSAENARAFLGER
jgi:predicted TIM-barrel fold metal-dependent hydrolase